MNPVSKPTFAIALPPEMPLEDLVALAGEIERLDYTTLWVNDDRLQKDVFTTLAALALNTERIRLGPGVTNPYSRHPALIASAIATLDELSGCRAVLGLGAGGTNHAMLGIRREAPADALRDAVTTIRGLLAGCDVTVEGRVVKTRAARLDFKPPRADIPILIGARGPLSLSLAGEVADGVIVGNLASEKGWRYALDRIAAGAERGGRELDELRLTAWFACSIADDASLALDAVRPLVATSLTTSRGILHELDVELPAAFAEHMEDTGWSLLSENVARAGQLVPDAIVRCFALAGTPDDCREQLRALLAAFPGITQVSIVPFPAPGESTGDLARRFMSEIATCVAPEDRVPSAGRLVS